MAKVPNASGAPYTKTSTPQPGNGGAIKTTSIPARATHAGAAQVAPQKKK